MPFFDRKTLFKARQRLPSLRKQRLVRWMHRAPELRRNPHHVHSHCRRPFRDRHVHGLLDGEAASISGPTSPTGAGGGSGTRPRDQQPRSRHGRRNRDLVPATGPAGHPGFHHRPFRGLTRRRRSPSACVVEVYEPAEAATAVQCSSVRQRFLRILDKGLGNSSLRR